VTRLLPCKCGHTPQLKDIGQGRWLAFCPNKDCGHQVVHVGDMFDTIKVWNDIAVREGR